MDFQYYIYIIIGILTLVIICRFFVFKYQKSQIKKNTTELGKLIKDLELEDDDV